MSRSRVRTTRRQALSATTEAAASVGEVEDLLADGIHRGLHARVQLELLQDVAHMVLDGVLRDEQRSGDVLVRHAAGDQLEHLELALGQARDRHGRTFLMFLDHEGELGQELRGHRRRDQRLPCVDRPQAIGDLLGGHILEQVAVRAGANGYLLKDVPAEEIADGLRAVYAGQSLISPSMASKLLSEFALMIKKHEE